MVSSVISPNSRWFTWKDYTFLSLLMLLSIAVGVYFYVWGNRKRSTSEYLTADHEMSPIPTGVSIAVSFISSSTVLGMPAEALIHGYMIVFLTIGQAIAIVPCSMFFAHLFHPLDITSPNEYLRGRFKSPAVAVMGYILSTLTTCLYIGVCMYGPALALNQASGNHISTTTAFLVSNVIGIIYTSIGGIKAVIWTDVIQAFFMVSALLATCIYAILKTGGLSAFVEYNQRFSRIHAPEFSFDPRVRHTVLGLTICSGFTWAAVCATPTTVQRLAAMPDFRTAQKAFAVTTPIALVFTSLAVAAGLAIFGYYAYRGCDVVAAGWLSSNNAVLTYYVSDQMNFLGFPGLVMAAIYASALSTLSSGLSSLGNTTWKDIMLPYCCSNLSDRIAAVFVKISVAVFGILSTVLGFASMQADSIITEAILALGGAVRGPFLSVLLLGAFGRWANKYGVIVGAVVGFGVGVVLNMLLIMASKSIQPLPTIVSNCSYDNSTYTLSSFVNVTSIPLLAHNETTNHYSVGSQISYVWIIVISSFATFIVGALVSLATSPLSSPVEEKYIWLYCRRKDTPLPLPVEDPCSTISRPQKEEESKFL